jgi:hypothetical protein
VEVDGVVLALAGVELVTAELAGAADVTADVEVAAWACRENTSRMVRIPAAKIATCTARQAM